MSTAVGTTIGRVTFVGGGFMGEGIIQGLLTQGLSKASELRVCEPVAARRKHLSERYGIVASTEMAASVAGAQIVVLAVKPQDFDAAARDLTGALKPEQLVLSIMAGVRIETLRQKLGHDRIVRTMPNTPLGIGEGFTVWTATEAVSAAERETVSALFGALGGEAYLPDEKYLDMATAVNGSGPGFIMLFVESMIDAAVLIGLRRDLATEMVLQTFIGSARLAQVGGQHPAQLRNSVASPAGTTAAGLHVLERAGVRAAIADAVVAAYERSRALGG